MSNIYKQSTLIGNSSIFHLLYILWTKISHRRRYQFILLFCLTLCSSAAEVISLGSVVPFIGILTQPEKVFAYPLVAHLSQTFGIFTAKDLVVPLSIIFAIAAVVAGGFRLLVLWISIRLVFTIGTDFSIDVYRRTLYQPYQVHLSRNSSEIISGITQKVGAATIVLTSLVTFITATLLFVPILATLLTINFLVAATAITGFGLSYALIAWKTKKQLARNSQCVAIEQTQVVKALQEGLGAIRDVLLDGAQDIYSDIYSKSIHKLKRANQEMTFMNQCPRYGMESFGLVLIAILALFLSREEGGIGGAIALLAVLALGAQRLLPLLQQVYSCWVGVMGSRTALSEVIYLLEQPLPQDIDKSAVGELEFKKSIYFENVRFRYASTTSWVIDGINLTISKGSRIGFIGTTGSGKSTTLDLLMALLEPTSGKITVDNQLLTKEVQRLWQRAIAHVPQNIFLADISIAENIAFGVPKDKINMKNVKEAAQKAQIATFIESIPQKYNTLVGERGVRLSGGQRQRIGIARALYKQAKVLVFDEATSALDSATEKGIMNAIENFDRELTIIMIAHRITTLRQCDTIIALEGGKIVAQGSYESFTSGAQGLIVPSEAQKLLC